MVFLGKVVFPSWTKLSQFPKGTHLERLFSFRPPGWKHSPHCRSKAPFPPLVTSQYSGRYMVHQLCKVLLQPSDDCIHALSSVQPGFRLSGWPKQH